VRAQVPEKIRRIGLLSPFSRSGTFLALRQGLRDLGWVEGKNIVFEYRYADGSVERLPELAAQLVRLRVDVICALNPPSAAAAQQATTVIPIVSTFAGDPVASGQAKSLARPGGNITGLSQMAVELAGKQLELLKEIVPKLTRVAVLWHSSGRAPAVWKELELSARRLSIQLHSLEVHNNNEFDKVIEDAARARVGAVFIIAAPVIVANLRLIALLAAKRSLPSIYHSSSFANVGGLVSYGPNETDMQRQAAIYLDKILKGAKPGDLPIEQPTKIYLVVNLQTAKAIGLTIPQNMLIRANRVIE
jgi:putative tryptophan/tyrosine transport system substrate-binding protein